MNNMRTCGADEYIALMDTMSDHRAMPEGNRTALYAGIREVILKHGGQIKKIIFFSYTWGESREKAITLLRQVI